MPISRRSCNSCRHSCSCSSVYSGKDGSASISIPYAGARCYKDVDFGPYRMRLLHDATLYITRPKREASFVERPAKFGIKWRRDEALERKWSGSARACGIRDYGRDFNLLVHPHVRHPWQGLVRGLAQLG